MSEPALSAFLATYIVLACTPVWFVFVLSEICVVSSCCTCRAGRRVLTLHASCGVALSTHAVFTLVRARRVSSLGVWWPRVTTTSCSCWLLVSAGHDTTASVCVGLRAIVWMSRASQCLGRVVRYNELVELQTGARVVPIADPCVAAVWCSCGACAMCVFLDCLCTAGRFVTDRLDKLHSVYSEWEARALKVCRRQRDCVRGCGW
jgi:hypothetical protein